MSDYELTPEEIDALSKGVIPPNLEPHPAGRGHQSCSVVQGGDTASAEQPLGWDETLFQVYRNVIESFAAGLASQLTIPLRTEVTIEVESVREAIYGELVIRMDNPTCVQLLSADPISADFVFEMHPTVLFPIFDRLLGGGSLPAPIVRRPLTEIETRLAGRVTRLVTAEMTGAWRPILPIECMSTALFSNPRMVRSENPNESMIVTQMRLTMAGCEGPIQIAIRKSALVELREQMLSPNPSASMCSVASFIGEVGLSRERLEQLQAGDVLLCPGAASGEATVHVDGKPAYLGRVGAVDGKKAVMVERVLRQD